MWTRFDWVAGDQYRVYPRPAESPNHTTPLPPSDGRVAGRESRQRDRSPFGWHDTNGVAGAEFTDTQRQQRRRPTRTSTPTTRRTPAPSPSGGAALNFDFPLEPDAGAQRLPARRR